jgi:hypothetical protein
MAALAEATESCDGNLPDAEALAHADDADEHPSKVARDEHFGAEHVRHGITQTRESSFSRSGVRI